MTMIMPSQTELSLEVELPGGVVGMAIRAVWDAAEKPFPLSPLECFYLMQGWSVRPAGDLHNRKYFSCLADRKDRAKVS